MRVYREAHARMMEVGPFRLLVERVHSNGWAILHDRTATAIGLSVMWSDASDGFHAILDRPDREFVFHWPRFGR